LAPFGPRERSIATLFALILAVGCGAPGAPLLPIQPTPVPNSQPAPAPNNPPRVAALTVSADRLEVGEEITLSASVLDDETSADDLTYQWQAAAGTIVGTGRTVKWRAPVGEATPATYKITLLVIDKYGSGEQTLEHRVTAESSVIHVDDSPKTVRELSEQFIREFADSSLSPQTCVRNFSDSCSGKQDELEDIIDNRQRFVILSHTIGTAAHNINASRTQATVSIPCEFTSRVKKDNSIEVAKGTCVLTLVNESYRWWLCSSRLRAGNAAALRFSF
jgi:hypothetical protein